MTDPTTYGQLAGMLLGCSAWIVFIVACLWASFEKWPIEREQESIITKDRPKA